MKEDTKQPKGFAESAEIMPLDFPPTDKFQKGNMSKPLKAALEAVENMEDKKKH